MPRTLNTPRPTTPEHMKRPRPSPGLGLTDSQSNARLEKVIEFINERLTPGQSIPPYFADQHRRFQPNPPNSTPADLFHAALNYCTVPGYRFIRKNDERQMLMFCDGACLDNGKSNPRGGCGVFIIPSGPDETVKGHGIGFSLENNGIVHTSNRAELRSVLGGLGLRVWRGEGFKSIVVAMDSQYVVLGITERINKWIERGWKTSAGKPVANKDIWEALLAKLRKLEDDGVHVQFWQIPREWNKADACAKRAASEISENDSEVTEGLVDVIMVQTPSRT